MVERYHLPGNDFVHELLAGRRTFNDMQLEKNFVVNRHPRADELRAYLAQADLHLHSLSFAYSDLSGLVMTSYRLDFVDAHGTLFPFAEFSGSSFLCAQLQNVNFTGARLIDVSFRFANLSGATLARSNLYHADFEEADLRSVQGLESAVHLGEATFLNTKVDGDAGLLIAAAYAQRPLFKDQIRDAYAQRALFKDSEL